MTTLANAVVWFLVVLGILAWRRPFTSTVAGTTSLTVPPTPVLVVLALIAAAGVASRVAIGILVPGDFVQEVVAYRSWIDSGSLYPADFGSEFRKWLNVEQPPFLSSLPPQVQEWRTRQLDQIVPLYAVQAHPPPLVIATFPLLAVLGSYGAFVAFSIAGIVAVGWTASRLAARAAAGDDWRRPAVPRHLLGLATDPRQPATGSARADHRGIGRRRVPGAPRRTRCPVRRAGRPGCFTQAVPGAAPGANRSPAAARASGRPGNSSRSAGRDHADRGRRLVDRVCECGTHGGPMCSAVRPTTSRCVPF